MLHQSPGGLAKVIGRQVGLRVTVVFDPQLCADSLERYEVIRIEMAGGAKLLYARRVANEVDLAVRAFEDHLWVSRHIVGNVGEDAAFERLNVLRACEHRRTGADRTSGCHTAGASSGGRRFAA